MSNLMLSLDTSLVTRMYDHSIGVTPETESLTREHTGAAIERVNERIAEQSLGFITTLDAPDIIEQIDALLDAAQWADTLVVVGIGGSDLGARAIQQALQTESSPFRVIFHGDSTDPIATTRLLSSINLKTTVFNIISKSGETVETIAQYILLKSLMLASESSAEWQKHFIFTTDEHTGILRKEADTHGIASIAIPEAVGGRFSVQTAVGLLPAAAMGVDCAAFLDGARSLVHSQEGRAVAAEFATRQYQLYRQGTKVTVLMPYSVQLEETARWFRQLWAESLGKDGKGILPIQARGPADQHSQVQFYVDGSPLQSLVFLRVEHHDDPVVLPQTDVAGVEYLSGHSLEEIIHAEQHATAIALAKAGRPSVTLSVPEISAESLGQTMLFFELAVVYLAEMLEINAFNQPGVEQGKQYMYALLDRSGYDRSELKL